MVGRFWTEMDGFGLGWMALLGLKVLDRNGWFWTWLDGFGQRFKEQGCKN